MEFQRKGDAYGRLFSHIPNVAKLFPNWSDFNRLRKGSMKMHQFMKVFFPQYAFDLLPLKVRSSFICIYLYFFIIIRG